MGLSLFAKKDQTKSTPPATNTTTAPTGQVPVSNQPAPSTVNYNNIMPGSAGPTQQDISLPDVPVGETPTIEEIEIPVSEGQIVTNISYTYSSNSLTINFDLEGTPDLTEVNVYYHYPQDNTQCGMIFYVSVDLSRVLLRLP